MPAGRFRLGGKPSRTRYLPKNLRCFRVFPRLLH